MDNKIKECEYQNICVNFNDNLYSKCPVFGWGNECCYAILYKQLLSEQAKNKKLVEALEKYANAKETYKHLPQSTLNLLISGIGIQTIAKQVLNEVNQ